MVASGGFTVWPGADTDPALSLGSDESSVGCAGAGDPFAILLDSLLVVAIVSADR